MALFKWIVIIRTVSCCIEYYCAVLHPHSCGFLKCCKFRSEVFVCSVLSRVNLFVCFKLNNFCIVSFYSSVGFYLIFHYQCYWLSCTMLRRTHSVTGSRSNLRMKIHDFSGPEIVKNQHLFLYSFGPRPVNLTAKQDNAKLHTIWLVCT